MPALIVRALMSSPVIAVAPHARLTHIKGVMREKGIRRVPVFERGRLYGIITLGDLRNAFPSDASSLSIHELSYLLDKVVAQDIMRTEVVTIAAAATVADAAKLMLKHKISGLPVIENGQLVGMLTESDIFRALIAGSVTLPLVVPVVTTTQPQRPAPHPIV